MTRNFKFFLASTAVSLMMLQAAPVQAAEGTVVRSTTVTKTQQVMPETGTRIVNFMDFDLNKDGILSTFEVGEMLFKLFDSDGNEVLDNVEYERRNVMTLVPMEKETIITFDFDNDGKADEIQHTYENFMESTHLTRFDDNGDGISPRDFAEKSLLEMDINRSKLVELNEWRGAYIESIAQKNAKHVQMNE